MELCEELESNVRSYCRTFPSEFHKSKGSIIYNKNGEEFLDFFAGAGALNYGHNNDYIKERVINYLMSDGIIHGLDMYTSAKENFIKAFKNKILIPENLDYKIQFCGPTGTNAVEAALKLARKIKNRDTVFSFMGAFHGVSLGSLSVTSNRFHRKGAGIPLNNVIFIPGGYGGLESIDSINYIESLLQDTHSGTEKPAAIIFETIQAEGGIYPRSNEWLERLRILCNEQDILLICDDIQTGCGRTGNFFSFSNAQIVPDIVVLSKSISGYGFPMSLVLMKSELDLWSPGEHNGTFRGNQIAFVAAEAALEYRELTELKDGTFKRASYTKDFLNRHIKTISNDIEIRGIGLLWGIDLSKCCSTRQLEDIQNKCFQQRLIVERVGRNDTVLKISPPLNIEIPLLEKGLFIIKEVLEVVLMD